MVKVYFRNNKGILDSCYVRNDTTMGIYMEIHRRFNAVQVCKIVEKGAL